MYRLNVDDAIISLASMKARHMTACWTCYICRSSVVVIESEYNAKTWRLIWSELLSHYDKLKPQKPRNIKEMKNKLVPNITNYITNESRNLGEVKRISGTCEDITQPSRWSAYFKPHKSAVDINSQLTNEELNDLCYQLAQHVETGINFLRVEASEILAFVTTDCDRIFNPAVPPHLPIAYGMKGKSLPMRVMRNMISDIRTELKNQNTSVLCEVYDGQFHQIIVRSEDGEPLTRLQHVIDIFKDIMKNKDRSELINELLMYSDITEDDKEYIGKMRFRNGRKKKLDSVIIEMKKVIKEKNILRRIYIETIDVNKIKMSNIWTNHCKYIWQRYSKKCSTLHTKELSEGLTSAEIEKLIKRSRLHRRIISQDGRGKESEISDMDCGPQSSDPDYDPSEESEISDIEYESDNDENVEPNVSTLSTTSVGQSCVSAILTKLTNVQNKHNWKHESVDSFIRNYLTTKKKIAKLFKYEMDIINEEVMATFNKVLFKRTDSKKIRVNKMFMQLRQMPEMLQYEMSDDDDILYYQPKSLYEIYKKFMTSTNYPKEFLAAAVCNIHHMENVEHWERKCKIPIQLNIPFLKDTHIIFNYPEYSKDRGQLEMKTFDYTHILNNLHYHICNRGFTGVSTKAFVNVSKVNHDVLPLAIVEDKLDRHNCVISQRFFSEDVKEILELNGNKSEAEFVRRTRNWYRVCNEREIDVKERLKYLNEMYCYLIGKCNISDYPPPTTHVEGIPIKTFEALLHAISTRFSLYVLSSKNSYNSRAISTLAVESFFFRLVTI